MNSRTTAERLVEEGTLAPHPTTSLIVIQPSPFCNIDCTYCYLPNRADKSRMTIDTVAAIFTKLLRFPTISEQVSVVWHAGEPLVLGTSYYEAAFARIAEVCPSGLQVDHSFQTNGILLNDVWCDLIERWDVKIGISIDGPASIHDLARRTRTGAGTFDRALAGLQRLRRRAIPFYVITVLTKAAFANPEALFAFYREHDIHEVGFNIEELEGVHQTSGLLHDFDEDTVTGFFEAFRRLMDEHQFFIELREIEDVMTSVRHLHPGGPVNNLAQPFGIVTVDIRGDVYTFSPELAGFSAAAYPTFSIGNILDQDFEDLARSDVMTRMSADINAGIAMCRARCSYFPVCGGGAPSNKIFENGTFASDETMYCRLTRKRVTDFVLGLIEERASS